MFFLSILLTIAALVGLMIIHETGHFLLAKKFGMPVEEFGIGLPPRIKKWKIGSTIYSLNLIPSVSCSHFFPFLPPPSNLNRPKALLLLQPIIRRLFGNDHIMDVAFAHAGGTDL